MAQSLVRKSINKRIRNRDEAARCVTMTKVKVAMLFAIFDDSRAAHLIYGRKPQKPEPEWNFGADKDREIFGRLGVAVDVGGAAHGN